MRIIIPVHDGGVRIGHLLPVALAGSSVPCGRVAFDPRAGPFLFRRSSATFRHVAEPVAWQSNAQSDGAQRRMLPNLRHKSVYR